MQLEAEPEVVCRWCGDEDAHYSEHCPELHPMVTQAWLEETG